MYPAKTHLHIFATGTYQTTPPYPHPREIPDQALGVEWPGEEQSPFSHEAFIVEEE